MQIIRYAVHATWHTQHDDNLPFRTKVRLLFAIQDLVTVLRICQIFSTVSGCLKYFFRITIVLNGFSLRPIILNRFGAVDVATEATSLQLLCLSAGFLPLFIFACAGHSGWPR